MLLFSTLFSGSSPRRSCLVSGFRGQCAPAGVRRAFSLIELLVVLAVITILAAILVPVTYRARESARSAACQGNLRQIGTAFQLYRVDNKNRMPKSYNDQNTRYWHHYLLGTATTGGVKYLDSDQVLRCPSAETTVAVSYGMSNLPIWYPALHRTDGEDWFFSNLNKPGGWPLAMDAEKTIIYGLDDPVETAEKDSRFAARHAGWANLVMVDGHIERARAGDNRWRQGVLNDGTYYSR